MWCKLFNRWSEKWELKGRAYASESAEIMRTQQLYNWIDWCLTALQFLQKNNSREGTNRLGLRLVRWKLSSTRRFTSTFSPSITAWNSTTHHRPGQTPYTTLHQQSTQHLTTIHTTIHSGHHMERSIHHLPQNWLHFVVTTCCCHRRFVGGNASEPNHCPHVRCQHFSPHQPPEDSRISVHVCCFRSPLFQRQCDECDDWHWIKKRTSQPKLGHTHRIVF